MNTPESIFLRIVETGSFKKAAEQLKMEPSTLSRKVTKLELRLNAKLLNRSTSRTTPTEVGIAYYAGLRKITDDQQSLEEEIFSNSKEIKGLLRIATTADLGDYLVTPIVQEMLSNAPGLNVQLILGSDLSDLGSHNIDVAIRIGKPENADIYAKYLGDIPRILVASPSYLKKRGTPEFPSELTKHSFILYSELQTKMDIQFQDGKIFSHTKIRSPVIVNSLKSIQYLVQRGSGINWGPKWLYKDDLASGAVTEVLPSFPVEGFTLNALYTTRKYLPYRVRWFMDLLQEKFNLDPLTTKQQ